MTTPSRRSVVTWAPVALKLLTQVVDFQDASTWNILLRNESALIEYFASIGLTVVIFHDDGFAYVTQPVPDGEDTSLPLPRLTPRVQLSYEATILVIVLREYFDIWTERTHASRCHITFDQAREACQPLFPSSGDDRTTVRKIARAFSQLSDLGYVRKVEAFGTNHTYEVRPLLRAKFGAAELEHVKEVLQHYASGI